MDNTTWKAGTKRSILTRKGRSSEFRRITNIRFLLVRHSPGTAKVDTRACSLWPALPARAT